jgi:hypothetical protein
MHIATNRLSCALLLAPVAAALLGAGCSNAKCGPGTQRAQSSSGDIVCVPVTVAQGTTECNPDAGVMLINGNQCVPDIQCGPGTRFDVASHQCVGVAMNAHDPPVCTSPGAGHICVNGTLRNLVDSSFLSGQTVTVTLYDAATFFGNPTPPELAHLDGISDTYMFPMAPTPGMYLLLVTSDPAGTTYQRTGIGITANDGEVIRLDGYVLSKTQYAVWGLPAAFESQGILFYRFFNDPPPPANSRTPTETHPTAGVTLYDAAANVPATDSHYFAPTLATIDGSATMTGAPGAVATSGTGLINFSGKGGGVTTWEAHQALPIPNILQVDFFHPQ